MWSESEHILTSSLLLNKETSASEKHVTDVGALQRVTNPHISVIILALGLFKCQGKAGPTHLLPA